MGSVVGWLTNYVGPFYLTILYALVVVELSLFICSNSCLLQIRDRSRVRRRARSFRENGNLSAKLVPNREILLFTSRYGDLTVKYFTSIAILSFLISAASIATAQICDGSLNAVDDPLIAYQLRSKRHCEGYYQSKVSSSSLNIVGLTHGRLNYELTSETKVPLSAPLATQTIKIRGIGAKLKTYYRMDGVIPVGGTLDWVLKDVVFPKRLADREVGLYGWFNNGEYNTYVPINFGVPGNIMMTLRSSVTVSKAQWRAAEAIGQRCKAMGPWKKVKRTPFRRGKTFRIQLPSSSTGKLCLEVAAKVGGSSRWLKLIERVQVVNH